jgi:hypothetical protein
VNVQADCLAQAIRVVWQKHHGLTPMVRATRFSVQLNWFEAEWW